VSPTPSALARVMRPDDVRDVRFHATKFRAGYDEEVVDDFLERVTRDLAARWAAVDAGFAQASSMPAPRLYLDAASMDQQAFPATKFRQGYRVEDVNDLLQKLAESFTTLDLYLRSFPFAAD
jgi:DivIVA domain-containing protein